MEHLGHEIYTKPEALDPAFCDELIELFERDDLKHPGLVGINKRYEPSIKNSMDLDIDPFRHPEEHGYIYKKIKNAINRDVDELMEICPGIKMLQGQDAMEVIDIHIQKSVPGKTCYIPHLDNSSTRDTIERVLVFIYYLIDVEEGGGTKFHRQGITVPCRKGNLLFFPPYWTHIYEGLAPTSSDKIIMTGWLKRVHL